MNTKVTEAARILRDYVRAEQIRSGLLTPTLEAQNTVLHMQALFDSLMAEMASLQRKWVANEIDDIIAATEPEALVADTWMSKERWLEVQALSGALSVFLNTPLDGVGKPPVVVISKAVVQPVGQPVGVAGDDVIEGD